MNFKIMFRVLRGGISKNYKIMLMVFIPFLILLQILLSPQDMELKILLLTPYVTEADIVSINEAYSETDNAPWGFAHPGIDFFPTPGKTSTTEFQAVADGVVQQVDLFKNNISNKWQVNVVIEYNNTYRFNYGFEPMSSSLIDGQRQLSYILVAQGDTVNGSQVIGSLYAPRNGAHVDFSLHKNNQFVCPEPYFTPAAHTSIMTILQNTLFPSEPNIKMCYF